MKQKTTKYQEWKEAIANPPPLRLASIEYRNHFLLIAAYIFASVILARNGFWYIVPVFIFSSMISYAAGVTAYQKYKVISQFSGKPTIKELDKDISFTRRRANIVKHIYGRKIDIISGSATFFLTLWIVKPTLPRLQFIFLFPTAWIFLYFFLYLWVFYWFAYPLFKAELKEVKEETKR